ncbi:MAG: PAS domain-containing protein, partial [Thermoanaerobaculia bacterium]|nr:PAS domain-containing protein [Thermoanaerobaculia bacterium]
MSRRLAHERSPRDRERRRMAAILDEITDLVGTADPQGRLLYLNPAGRRLVGIGDDEKIADLHISSFHPGWARATSIEEAIPVAIRDGTWRGKSALLARGGEEIPVEQVVIAHRGPDRKVTHISTVARDLREALRVEEELRTSRERMRTILEHSSNVFYSHTPEGEITYASPQTRDFFDCSPEDALRGWSDFLTDHPENRRAMEHTRRALETGEKQPVYELEMESASGRRLWVEVNEAPVVEDGEVVAIVGALTDITARKRAEARRRELEEQL